MDDKHAIESVKNPIVRRFRAAAGGDPPEHMVADGIKLVWEAMEAKLPIVEAAVSPRLHGTPLGKDVRRRLEREAGRVHECSESVLERLSSLDTPQGVVAILRRPAYQFDDLFGEGRAPLVAIAAGVKDPGNLGALARTAEAAAATGLVAIAGGADPFRDKAVRGSAGSIFRLPTLGPVALARVFDVVAAGRLQLVVADADGDVDWFRADYTKPTAVVLGGEGGGVPEELLSQAAVRVRIPMATPVESLNVAVAAGIVLFEARRQRLSAADRG